MNQNVAKLLEKLENNPILLNRLSSARDLDTLYKKAIKIVEGYTISDLKFALEELEIISPQQDPLSYVSGGIVLNFQKGFFNKNQPDQDSSAISN